MTAPVKPRSHDVTGRFRMPRRLMDRLQAVAGEGGKSRVVREAVERWLDEAEGKPIPVTVLVTEQLDPSRNGIYELRGGKLERKGKP